MIRLATHDDIPRLLEMVREFISMGPYRDHRIDDDVVTEVIQTCLDYTKNVIFVYTRDDYPVGLLMAVTSRFLFNRETIASEVAWWVAESSRGRGGLLLKAAFEQWARRMGARYSHMSSLATSSVHRIFERDGYVNTELTFMKELTC